MLIFKILSKLVAWLLPQYKLTSNFSDRQQDKPVMPSQPLHELCVVSTHHTEPREGYPSTVVFATVPNVLRYYVNHWKLNNNNYYVFYAYSWGGKLLWQEVYTYDLPMYNSAIWARYFPLMRLDSALRQDLVKF